MIGAYTIGDARMAENPGAVIENPERENHDFLGWSFDGSTVIKPNMLNVTADTELKAVWKGIFTVTYDAGDGVFADGRRTRTENAAGYHVISGEEPVRQNHRFTGWILNGTALSGTSISVNRDVVLMAAWEPVFTVQLAFADGTTNKTLTGSHPYMYDPSGDSTRITFENDTCLISTNDMDDMYSYYISLIPTVTGAQTEESDYVWEESEDLATWTDSLWDELETDDGFQIQIDDAAASMHYYRVTVDGVTSNTVLLRCNIDGTVRILTLDANGGEFSNGAKVMAERITGGLWAPTYSDEPTRGDHTFMGWQYNDQLIGDHEEIRFNGDATIYASWENNLPEYTVTYDAGEGRFEGNQRYRYETDTAARHEIFSDEPSRTGYRFAGWALNDQTYGGGDRVAVTGDTILTAQWVQRVTLTYNGNGGTFYDGETTCYTECDMNGTVSIGTSDPTMNNAFFDGWRYADGSRAEGQITMTEDLTVYAAWVTGCTITLDAGAGSFTGGGNQKQVVAAMNSTYWPNEVPTRNGYVFDGWSGEYGNPVGYVVTDQASITLTARWLEDYTVKPSSVTISTEDEFVRIEQMPGPGSMDGADAYMSVSAIENVQRSDWNSLYYEWQVSGDQENWYVVYDNYSGTEYAGTGLTNCNPHFDTFGTSFFRVRVNGTYSNVIRITAYDDWSYSDQYVLTYDAGDGMFSGGSKVRCEMADSGDYTLSTYDLPRRDGYEFQGWLYNGEPAVSVEVVGDMTVTASWQEKQVS